MAAGSCRSFGAGCADHPALPCAGCAGAAARRSSGGFRRGKGAGHCPVGRLPGATGCAARRHLGDRARTAPPGAGTGMSSASLTAVAQVTGVSDGDAVLRACLAVEGATDPVMLKRPDTHLWASREGRSLLRLEAPPATEIVGGYWGPPLRTDAGDGAFPDIADLLAPWAEAVAAGDLAGVADIASTSARRTTANARPRRRSDRAVGARGRGDRSCAGAYRLCPGAGLCTRDGSGGGGRGPFPRGL